jgi:hypothetical protein
LLYDEKGSKSPQVKKTEGNKYSHQVIKRCGPHAK